MSSPDPQISSKLPHLPVELLSNIASTLNTQEFGAFRLTCRLIEHKIQKYFANSMFAQQQVMVTTPSLTSLLGIARHPTFSQSLKRLSVGSDSYQATIFPSFDGPQGAAALAGLADQALLVNTGAWRGMLADAMRLLPNLHTIDVRDYNSPTRFRDGKGAMWRSLGAVSVHEQTGMYLSMHLNADPAAPTRWTNMLFQNLVLASAEAGVRPAALEIILKFSGVSDFALYPSPAMAPVLANLTKVHLDINNLALHGVHAPPHGLMHFLNAIPKVEWLRINFKFVNANTEPFLLWMAEQVAKKDRDGGDEGGHEKDGDEKDGDGKDTITNGNTDNATATFAATTSKIPSPAFAHLARLELGMFVVKTSTLEAVLAKLAPTLTHLGLHKMGLRQEVRGARTNLWAKFLERRSETGCTLDEMSLGHVSQLLADHHDLPVSFKTPAGGRSKTCLVRNDRRPGAADAWLAAANDVDVYIPEIFYDDSDDMHDSGNSEFDDEDDEEHDDDDDDNEDVDVDEVDEVDDEDEDDEE